MKKSKFFMLFLLVTAICLVSINVVFADQEGNRRWCNSDQYGCWVTAENGGQSYLMFWSESVRDRFMGPGSSAPVSDPVPGGEMALPPAPDAPAAPASLANGESNAGNKSGEQSENQKNNANGQEENNKGENAGGDLTHQELANRAAQLQYPTLDIHLKSDYNSEAKWAAALAESKNDEQLREIINEYNLR